GRRLADSDRDVVGRLGASDTDPVARRVAGLLRLGERPGIRLQARAAVDGAGAGEVVGARAVGGEREVRLGLRAAVVVHDVLAQKQLRRDVVVGDGAGLGLPEGDRAAAVGGERLRVAGVGALVDAVGAAAEADLRAGRLGAREA